MLYMCLLYLLLGCIIAALGFLCMKLMDYILSDEDQL